MKGRQVCKDPYDCQIRTTYIHRQFACKYINTKDLKTLFTIWSNKAITAKTLIFVRLHYNHLSSILTCAAYLSFDLGTNWHRFFYLSQWQRSGIWRYMGKMARLSLISPDHLRGLKLVEMFSCLEESEAFLMRPASVKTTRRVAAVKTLLQLSYKVTHILSSRLSTHLCNATQSMWEPVHFSCRRNVHLKQHTLFDNCYKPKQKKKIKSPNHILTLIQKERKKEEKGRRETIYIPV
jgi:hypothetical protein